MRVAFFVNVFPKFSETFVVSQIAGLIDRGHDVQVFGRRPPGVPLDPLPARYRLRERTHHYRCGLNTLPHALSNARKKPGDALRALGRTLLERRPATFDAASMWGCATALLAAGPRFDAIIAHFGPNALLAQRMRELGVLHGGLLSVFHGHDASRAVRKHGPHYYAPVFAHSELVLPVSEYFGQRLHELGCPRKRLRVHHMGVDLDRFEFKARRLDGSSTVRLLSVCRLVEKKGMDHALRAAARLRAAGATFAWQILGEGPELPKLRALAQKLDLASSVQLLGGVSHDAVREALQSAHLFVAPSVTAIDGDEEGIPVAIMEAAAAGLPIVSTRHSGIPELVRHGETGLLAPERDVEQLATNLLTLIRAPERWAALGAGGRAIVADEFNARKLDDRLAVLAERAAIEHRELRPLYTSSAARAT